ncbi:hypothetical protein TNCV_5121061 [Trichonephila clavipes]|nr:hypothetical protein TNCV_5121061 [Trichonephila clavipes]
MGVQMLVSNIQMNTTSSTAKTFIFGSTAERAQDFLKGHTLYNKTSTTLTESTEVGTDFRTSYNVIFPVTVLNTVCYSLPPLALTSPRRGARKSLSWSELLRRRVRGLDDGS